MSIYKTLLKKLGQAGVQNAQCGAVSGGRNRAGWLVDIRETALPDAFFNWRRFAAVKPLGAEGMAAVHEQLEGENSQAKAVVFRQTMGFCKGLSL